MKYSTTSEVRGGILERPYLRAQNGEATLKRFRITAVILFN
jgi:hypothetical protein